MAIPSQPSPPRTSTSGPCRARVDLQRFSPLLLLLIPLLASCHASSHPVLPAGLGVPVSEAELAAVVDAPGPIEIETVRSANWEVERSGLINLDHERAKAAGLEDGDEPIHIAFHALLHPRRGLFLVDTGVERRYRDARDDAPLSWLVRSAMNMEKLEVLMPLGDYLAARGRPVSGVFLTHLHLDHIMGVSDMPASTPLYIGPGEAEDSRWVNFFSRSSVDDTLEGHAPLREFRFFSGAATPDASRPAKRAAFEGVIDVFADRTLFALWVPGHTPGSVAYLVRTPKGPVLLTGDACHSRWGWKHQVEPGSFSSDQPRSARSLAALELFVKEHPTIDVRLGHQEL